MQQGSCDVVTGLCAFAGREFRGVGEYLHSSVRDALARTAGHASVRDLGQLVEPTPVFQRNAEQFGDHLGRQRPGDVIDGVALTLLDNAVDHVARHVRDVLIELGDLPRGTCGACGRWAARSTPIRRCPPL